MIQNVTKAKEEFIIGLEYKSVKKDILIVVHNQLEYVKNCVESIANNTENYDIYIWDNGSDDPTKNYLETFSDQENVHLVRSEDNLGFIVPNNKLIQMGNSPFVILLNSDTVVYPKWDETMIAWLQQHSDVAEIGYMGGKLNSEGQGYQVAWDDADFICGWCFCISRETYDSFGLFDDVNLSFAYGEDSDFSLRLKEAGKRIHVLHASNVYHFGSQTTKSLKDKSTLSKNFERNHDYIKARWSNELGKD